MISRLYHWFDRNVLELGRELRLSYLPPIMVYMAYGISTLTNVVGAFFIKDYLDLSAEFLAALMFWANVPWILKMPLGHLVDLIWRYKSILVFIGAGLIATSLLIMIGLLSQPDEMQNILPISVWYVTSVLLAPVGYVIQDVVADAMTVEAIPRVDAFGKPLDPARIKLMHTTMQTLGRAAIVGGGISVGLLNLYMFSGIEGMSKADKVPIYIDIFQIALLIPVISVLGVSLGGILKIRDAKRLQQHGYEWRVAWDLVHGETEKIKPNWWILIGSLIFVIFTISIGTSDIPWSEEIVFSGSMAIVIFLMVRLVRLLDEHSRQVLVGTAIIIFVYRAMPTPGQGESWWMIDELGFDEQFLTVLGLIFSSLALFGMFLFRRFMAERSIAYVIGFLTIVTTILYLPTIGMYYGLHEWTAAMTNGVVDARFIALVSTAIESPLGQVAMIPMLAWIANSAPANLKATFFAVMASFTNLALSLSQLGTKYVNQIYLVTREVRDQASGAIIIPADYSELGILFIVVSVIGLLLPLGAIALVKATPLRCA
jgi:hypothetical protein